MKILEIIPSFYPVGGAERFTSQLSLALTKNDSHIELMIVCLYAKNDQDPIAEELAHKGIDVCYLNKKKGVDFRCAKHLKNVISSFKPDIIHAHLNTYLTLFLARPKPTIPIFYTFHTFIDVKVLGKKNKPLNLLMKHLLTNKRIIPIAISNIIRDSICSYYSLCKENVPVIENGVPLECFYNNKNWANRAYDFLFVGRFIELKNPLVIVKAFESVSRLYNSKISLAMVGDGPLLTRCRQYVDNNKIANIYIPGFCNEMKDYYSNAKCLVMASDYEGNPIVINEAVASKCWVISSSVGGVPDIINDGNGFLFDPTEMEQNLQKKLILFLNNQDKIEKEVNDNYAINSQKCSIYNCALSHLNLFATHIKQ